MHSDMKMGKQKEMPSVNPHVLLILKITAPMLVLIGLISLMYRPAVSIVAIPAGLFIGYIMYLKQHIKHKRR